MTFRPSPARTVECHPPPPPQDLVEFVGQRSRACGRARRSRGGADPIFRSSGGRGRPSATEGTTSNVSAVRVWSSSSSSSSSLNDDAGSSSLQEPLPRKSRCTDLGGPPGNWVDGQVILSSPIVKVSSSRFTSTFLSRKREPTRYASSRACVTAHPSSSSRAARRRRIVAMRARAAAACAQRQGCHLAPCEHTACVTRSLRY